MQHVHILHSEDRHLPVSVQLLQPPTVSSTWKDWDAAHALKALQLGLDS